MRLKIKMKYTKKDGNDETKKTLEKIAEILIKHATSHMMTTTVEDFTKEVEVIRDVMEDYFEESIQILKKD